MEKVSRSPFVLVVLVVVYLFCFSTAADAKAKVDSTDTDHQTWHTDSAEQCPHAVDPAITSLLSDDPYVVLGLPRDATDARITKKFRTLARKWHPDKNRPNEDSSSSCAAATSATTLFTAIGHAYNILSDPEKRDVYDRLGVLGLRRLQDGDPRVKRHYLPPDEVLRRHGSEYDPPLSMMDWVITSIFAWLEGKPSYD